MRTALSAYDLEGLFRLDDGYALKVAEHEQVSIAGDDQFSGGSERAGEYVIVVWVSRDDARHGGWCDEGRDAAQIIDQALGGESGLLKAC